MADFIASFDGRTYQGPRFRRFFGYSKDVAVRLAKQIGDETGATEIMMEYMSSGKNVGFWEKKGSRWYRV